MLGMLSVKVSETTVMIMAMQSIAMATRFNHVQRARVRGSRRADPGCRPQPKTKEPFTVEKLSHAASPVLAHPEDPDRKAY
jgi:hypothetical protein